MFAPPAQLKVYICLCQVRTSPLIAQCPSVRGMIDMFMSAKEQDIAEQLTLIDFNIYAAMEVYLPVSFFFRIAN